MVHLSQLLEDLVIASPQTSRQENVRRNMAEYPALFDDRRASLTVLARDTIGPGDYVVVTDEGARRLSQTPWPDSGAILGRALERIEAGHRGRVRKVS